MGSASQHAGQAAPQGETARARWGFCTIRSLASACRRRVAPLLVQFFPPRLLAVRSRFGVVWCPQCRPPRWKMADMGLLGQTVCDAGNSDTEFTPATPPHWWGLRGWCCSVRCPDAQLWLSTRNFACNSPATLSNLEIRSLELQRFQTLLKLHPIELHATFLRPGLAAARLGRARC